MLNNKKFFFVIFSIFFLFCNDSSKKPTVYSIEGSYSLVAGAISSNNSEKLYSYLTQKSRTSLGIIYKTQNQIQKLIKDNLPSDKIKSVNYRWPETLDSKNIIELFVKYCAKNNCIKNYRTKLGGINKISDSGKEKIILTSRGGEFKFIKDKKGRWFFSNFEKIFDVESSNFKRDLKMSKILVENFKKTMTPINVDK